MGTSHKELEGHCNNVFSRATSKKQLDTQVGIICRV